MISPAIGQRVIVSAMHTRTGERPHGVITDIYEFTNETFWEVRYDRATRDGRTCCVVSNSALLSCELPKLSLRKRDVIREDAAQEHEAETMGIPLHGWPTKGSIYYDHSSKGNQKKANRWVGEFYTGGVHFRHRSKNRLDCEQWVKAVRMGRIKPWDNGADWMLTEQRRDMKARYGETIVSQAEEAMLLLNYSMSGELTDIMSYMERRLLPHMVYYCCHTLRMGRDTSLTSAKDAVALLLTDITAGKPISGFTRVAKRMLRVRKEHGSFWYYEKAPHDIQMLIDGIDFAPLQEVWKVTRDRRI